MSRTAVHLSGTMLFACPAFIRFTLIVVLPSSWSGFGSLIFRIFSSNFCIDCIALIPFSGIELCTALPMVVISSQSIPRCALIVLKSVGSVIIMPCRGGNFSLAVSINFMIPALSVSSPAVAAKIRSPARIFSDFFISVIAAAAAAIGPFISAAPLAKSLFSFIVGWNGGVDQMFSFAGTTSRCASSIIAFFCL